VHALAEFFLQTAAFEKFLEAAQRGAYGFSIVDAHSQRHTVSFLSRATQGPPILSIVPRASMDAPQTWEVSGILVFWSHFG